MWINDVELLLHLNVIIDFQWISQPTPTVCAVVNDVLVTNSKSLRRSVIECVIWLMTGTCSMISAIATVTKL